MRKILVGLAGLILALCAISCQKEQPQSDLNKLNYAQCTYNFDLGDFVDFANVTFVINNWDGKIDTQELLCEAESGSFDKVDRQNVPAVFCVGIVAMLKEDFKVEPGTTYKTTFNYELSATSYDNEGKKLSSDKAARTGGSSSAASIKELKEAIAELNETLFTVSVDANGAIEVEVEKIPPTEPQEKVTIMFYSAGGGNLDSKQIWKMRQCASLGAEDWLNMTFEYKFSSRYQVSTEDTGINGVLRLDLADCGNLKGCEVFPYKNLSGKEAQANMFKNIEGLPFETIDNDPARDMSDPKNIAEFIKWSAKKHPADKYVLIFADHGGGWSVVDDHTTLGTKGIIYDDNVYNSLTKGYNKTVSARNIAKGVEMSEIKIDYLYCDACLMGAFENIYEYKSVADYFVSSMETSTGGNYDLMMKAIKENHGDLYSGFLQYIDNHVEAQESDGTYVDLSIIDLKKVSGALTPVVKKTIDYIVSLADDKNAFSFVCAAARTATGSGSCEVWIPNAAGEAIKKIYGEYSPVNYDEKTGQYKYRTHYILRFKENHLEEWSKLDLNTQISTIYALSKSYCYGICFADFLYQLHTMAPEAEEYSAIREKAEQLFNEYIAAVKSVLYCRCTKTTFYNQAYVECSPSVNLLALNEEGWVPTRRSLEYNGIYAASVLSLDEAIANYQDNAFDKEVQWSRFLLKNTFNINVISNVPREARYNKN